MSLIVPQTPFHINILMSLEDDRWLRFNDDIAAFNKKHDLKQHDLPQSPDNDVLIEGLLCHILQVTYKSADLLFKTTKCQSDQSTKPHHIEISVILCDDTTIHDINRDHRGKDKPTNILSFPTLEGGDMMMPPMHNDNKNADNENDPNISAAYPTPIGDLILSYDRVIDESHDQEKPKLHHLIHLIIHGCLHLMGYDHIDEKQASIMEKIEIDILDSFGVKNPYYDSFSMTSLDA